MKTQGYLLDYILVRHDYWALLLSRCSYGVNSYVLKGDRVLDVLFLCFPFLNLHDIVYCIPYVKSSYVFSELAPFYLRVVEKVLNHVAHQVG